MSDPTSKALRVFFSWQSDSPKEANLAEIRKAIDAAAKGIKKKFPNRSLVRDEATRGAPGSPNIATTLFQKIDVSDVFVADITTVTPKGSARPSANPNVLIELGYAVAQLGWDRIVLLFNESVGTFPADLPFDIIQNRVGRFHLDLTDAADTADHITELRALVLGAISAVAEKNPKFPRELQGKSWDAVRHERDVENIRWLLEQVHVATLDRYITRLPRVFQGEISWFWESFKAVVNDSSFYLYDTSVRKAVDDLYNDWHDTVRFGQFYHVTKNDMIYEFGKSWGPVKTEAEQSAWNTIEGASSRLPKDIKTLIELIRKNYVEIDINQASARALEAYDEFVAKPL